MNKDHLLELANHLRYGKLIHQRFDFSAFNALVDLDNDKYDEKGCGTIGCALGECPGIWPQEWSFDDHSLPVILGQKFTEESAEIWFDISQYEVRFMFFPNRTLPWMDNTQLLDEATKEDVADSIEAFISWKEAGE